ncbi:short-chain dehydrogenase/reductase 2b-like isoform X2 [Actinidia eriantha]|uniref:short-chain dehydrogenase/reductase 2b-like isoform X2 n=1 Tax=Actinidia eriantha TaxID=165200 RepID=UPI00258BB9E9|nr:short-chain dehydrogenase/reductase 2b-like isoform X2 [Actinidia eriantha]
MEEEISQLPKRIALVTGASKGIGLEICRQLASNGVKVLLTARDEKRGLEALQKLKVSGLSDVSFHQLDVTDKTSVACLADFIKTKFKKLDILIVGPKAKSLREVLKQSYQVGEACLRTNYFGVKLVTEELIPLLQLSETPTIVNVSSTLGQLKLISNEKVKNELSNVDSLTEEKVDEVVREFLEDLKEDLLETKGWPIIFSAYMVSKAALNGYTKVLAKKFPNIATNAVSPGFVKTDLNHNSGILSVEEGARGPVRLALFPNGGASGLFFDQMEVSTF